MATEFLIKVKGRCHERAAETGLVPSLCCPQDAMWHEKLNDSLFM